MLIYHGSTVIVEKPEIRTAKFHKDFNFALKTIRFVEGVRVYEEQ